MWLRGWALGTTRAAATPVGGIEGVVGDQAAGDAPCSTASFVAAVVPVGRGQSDDGWQVLSALHPGQERALFRCSPGREDGLEILPLMAHSARSIEPIDYRHNAAVEVKNVQRLGTRRMCRALPSLASLPYRRKRDS